MPITRRAALGLISSSTFFLTVPRGLAAAVTLEPGSPALGFPQGVASGDPQPDGIMLWTRSLPEPTGPGRPYTGPIPLILQLGTTADFSSPLLQAEVSTDATSDYTVRSYIDGLAPDTTYYYRFLGGAGSSSRIGRTRTAPAPGQEREVRLAFVSCQNFEQGYYGSWARLLEDDAAAPEQERIDFVLHLGDFIYERCWNKRQDGSPLSRRVPPFPDGAHTTRNRYAVSLADYRHLYQTYLSDPYLQEARARWPFVCIWDDHEFSDNSFQSYVTYGDTPLADPQRKLRANQAWFEYIPTVLAQAADQPAHDFKPGSLSGEEAADNQTAQDSLCVYRQLRWGKYLDLVLTDNRSYRSPPCVPDGLASSLGLPLNTVELVAITDGGSAYADGNPPAMLPFGDQQTPNPARERPPGTCLGLTQRDWLIGALDSSDARWKVWGNSLPLLPMRLDMSALPFAGYKDSIFNIDAWSGYPHEQAYLMQQLEERKISGVVSLSGDHHMHGAGTIRRSTTDPAAAPVMADFNVAGISSSPIFDELVYTAKKKHPDFQPLVFTEEQGQMVPVWNMSMIDGVFAAFSYSKTGLQTAARWLGPNRANPGLAYVDTNANGYGLARFNGGELQVQLVTVTACCSAFVEPPPISHIARFSLPHWQPGEPPVLAGPTFEKAAPFPFPAPTV